MDLRVPTIATILGVPEQDVHDYMDARIEAFEEIEKDYFLNERPRILKLVRDMDKDFPEHERAEMRRRYLLGKIQEIKPKYLETQDPILREELKSLLFEAKIYTGEVEGFTMQDIGNARNFPITRLIKNRGMMALCPFHNEKTPSLNLKGNFYYCHGCGATGDVIDFLMKKDGLTFRQAIMKLHS